MPTDTHFPASKTAYVYDSTGREYLGNVEVYLQLDKTYALPSNVIEAQPPKELKPYTWPRRNVQGDDWDLVPDYRSVMLWDKTTARPVPNNLKLGDRLPASLTVMTPPTFAPDEHKAPSWDSQTQTWTSEPDWRGFHYWLADGSFHQITKLDDIPPEGYLTKPPGMDTAADA
jgi:hypothetical protein